MAVHVTDSIELYDVVRIKSLRVPMQVEPDGISTRAPRVGDVATVIEIHESPPGYELECSGSGGTTEWLRAFAPSDVELERIR